MLIKGQDGTMQGGSRIGIILNGSPLFTGGAGSGESEIRRHLLENDLVEAIVALPTDMFYNTGIATYIWILSNRKPAHRKGLVQLIHAVDCSEKMRKSLMPSENEPDSEIPIPPAHQRGADAGDLILAALDHLRGSISGDGETSGSATLARQEARLREWADRLGLLLNAFKITDSAYYRPEDNLGIFDAHDKNLVRAGAILVPFDVIPCHPAGGFLTFIEETLAAGHTLRAVRTVTTRQS